MKKPEIIQHYEDFNQWVEANLRVDRKVWLRPIKPGKWSIAEIMAHLVEWDRYFLN